jgi:hypothetical protein
VDRCGKVLSHEGQSRDQGVEEPWPDRPLKLGETFSVKTRMTGIAEGKTYVTAYTLEKVETHNDRRIAVLSCEVDCSWACWSGTLWKDLDTGLVAKSSIRGQLRWMDGTWTTMTGTSILKDSNGRRWVE